MNIILTVSEGAARAILDGYQTAELRRRIPVQLNPGDTVYLAHSGLIHGHCTFGGLNIPPEGGLLLTKWLQHISHAANTSSTEARTYLSGAKQPCALLLRYPVPYSRPRKSPAATTRSYTYTHDQPTRVHPQLANFLLYLNTHKQQ